MGNGLRIAIVVGVLAEGYHNHLNQIEKCSIVVE